MNYNYNHNELKSLTNLKLPMRLIGSLDVAGNNLTNLVGAPETIKGDLYAADNKITSLLGIPKYVHQLQLQGNKISKIDYFPEHVNYFKIDRNQLTTVSLVIISVFQDMRISYMRV